MTRAGMLVLALVLAGCPGGGDGGTSFLEPCTSDSDCPGGWTCPLDGMMHTGEMENVCTPSCLPGTYCEEILEREDVFCFEGGFCALECSIHGDCPEELPYCRGSDPSCDTVIDQPWCALEDYVCTP